MKEFRISDPDALAGIYEGWAGVLAMQEQMATKVRITAFGSAGWSAPSFANIVYNLPTRLAFNVLGTVLAHARDEDLFTNGTDHLGPLVDAAKDVGGWIDWNGIRAGVKRRNKIAHHGVLFSHDECFEDMNRIEDQLVAWGLIRATTKA